MARILATSANDSAHALICDTVNRFIQTVQEQHTLRRSRPQNAIAEHMKDSNTVGITFSSDNGGGEEEVNETWTPMAEAMRKGIFSRLIVLSGAYNKSC
jgi:hypothetical protein